MRTCFFIAHVKKGKKCQGEERKGQKVEERDGYIEMAAAAAAKSLQSCPNVRPHRRSPPGSPVPGILQARALEWVAISFSNIEMAWREKK